MVYPRACGGTTSSSPVKAPVVGLSPRLRGNRAAVPAMRAPGRSIPAPAGEPREQHADTCPHRVYPRACGGTADSYYCNPGATGLSPRLRGNLGIVSHAGHKARSIPAPAGEPSGGTPWTAMSWVYPRACGGTANGVQSVRCHVGLSPRLRGNRRKELCPCDLDGSIPAPAGEPSAHFPMYVPS